MWFWALNTWRLRLLFSSPLLKFSSLLGLSLHSLWLPQWVTLILWQNIVIPGHLGIILLFIQQASAWRWIGGKMEEFRPGAKFHWFEDTRTSVRVIVCPFFLPGARNKQKSKKKQDNRWNDREKYEDWFKQIWRYVDGEILVWKRKREERDNCFDMDSRCLFVMVTSHHMPTAIETTLSTAISKTVGVSCSDPNYAIVLSSAIK